MSTETASNESITDKTTYGHVPHVQEGATFDDPVADDTMVVDSVNIEDRTVTVHYIGEVHDMKDAGTYKPGINKFELAFVTFNKMRMTGHFN